MTNNEKMKRRIYKRNWARQKRGSQKQDEPIAIMPARIESFRCTNCGDSYPANKMFNANTCDGCHGFYDDNSMRPGTHRQLGQYAGAEL
jgi:hypothetical protein